MILRLDAESVVPPYEQIREQIATMVISGVLAPGTPLPSIRQLAADLGVAPGTVARAYTELDNAGIVHSRTGRGTVVTGKGPQLRTKQAESELRKAAEAFTQRVRQLGVSSTKAMRAIEESLGDA